MITPRYPPWIRHLHWLVFLLVACALVLIYVHHWSARGTAIHASAKWAHTQFGMAILLVMLPRLLIRARGSVPPIAPQPPHWQQAVARLVHWTLYALLFATPLLGIATMAWKGQPWDFLGIPLPSVPVPDRLFSHKLEHIHETFGNVLMYLAATHALVALGHHFLQRDDTLRRMLPPARSRD